MKHRRKHVANEQGNALVMVTVSLVALLSMAALAIDLGMLFNSRSEAQRAADAAALAGASTFQTPMLASEIIATAESRARDYAGRNRVGITGISAGEVGVEVFVNEGRVRATVTRRAIPLWFARVLGVTQQDVQAVAAARVDQSGTAECIAPLMIPDWWVDANRNGVYNAGEYYAPTVTGYGLQYRNVGQPGYPYVSDQPPYVNDLGRRVTLKTGSADRAMQPGWYFPIRVGDNTGGADFRADLGRGCPDRRLSIGDLVYSEPGAMQGPTKQGLDDRMSQDPNARWVEGQGIVNSAFGGGTGDGSPRIMVVPLFNPTATIPNGASAPMEVHNFGSFFIEGISGNGDITGRWMRVRGVPDNCFVRGNCRSYMQALRLVQ